MTDALSLPPALAALSKTLRRRLGLKGNTLADQLARAERHLPRHLRADAARLTQVEAMLSHPRLSRMIPPGEVQASAARLTDWARETDLNDKRIGAVLRAITVVGFNLLVVAGLALALLRWRGLA